MRGHAKEGSEMSGSSLRRTQGRKLTVNSLNLTERDFDSFKRTWVDAGRQTNFRSTRQSVPS